jgi:hypothetical protein
MAFSIVMAYGCQLAASVREEGNGWGSAQRSEARIRECPCPYFYQAGRMAAPIAAAKWSRLFSQKDLLRKRVRGGVEAHELCCLP